MVIILCLYVVALWLVFSKFKLVRWGWLSGTISLLTGGFILATFLALFNYLTPSGRVTVTGRVVEVTPNVTGQIIAIPVKPNVPVKANGVLYALAGFSGGVTCYVKDGILSYEFNLFEVQRTKIKAREKLPTGKVRVDVESKLAAKIGGPMDVTLRVNGKVVGQGQVPAAMSLHFTSNATFDIGSDTDSPVSLDYFDQAPFAWNGSIGTTKVTYLKK